MTADNSSDRAIFRVFISSTSQDLGEYREAAREACLELDMFPIDMKFFEAMGKGATEGSLAKLKEADVYVGFFAYRYGYVEEGYEHSVTELEFDYAGELGLDRLCFLVDPSYPWPPERIEFEQMAELNSFKQRIEKQLIRALFTDVADFKNKVREALYRWRDEHRSSGRPGGASHADDPLAYLQWLHGRTSRIDLKGLQAGSEAMWFPIEELYIPLAVAGGADGAVSQERNAPKFREIGGGPRREADGEGPSTPLSVALANPRLVVVGDPGSGKTTFLHRIACAMCNALTGESSIPAEQFGLEEIEWCHLVPAPLPLFIRAEDLANHIRACRKKDPPLGPAVPTSPAWIAHYLATASEEYCWWLDEDFFRDRLVRGAAVVLVDGLDEPAAETERQSLAELISAAAAAFPLARFVISTRPMAYQGKTVLRDFPRVEIADLEDDAIKVFLTRWCEALYPGSPAESVRQRDGLLESLAVRPEIRRLARTPVMLTALAVVYYNNNNRIPEQRAELYELIVDWLVSSRPGRVTRPAASRCKELLQRLALSMHLDPGGRRVSLSRREAAEAIAPEIRADSEKERIALAAEFLEQEELHSGIVSRRGGDMRFRHLTFQEFLTARGIAAEGESEQHRILLSEEKFYDPSWREAVLLLAGVLYEQGEKKVDGLVSAVLDDLQRTDAPLGRRWRCAGLLGAVLRDLAPFDYRPLDDRFRRLMHEEVMQVFVAGMAAGVPIEVAIDAAEALGFFGDPRLEKDAWLGHWVNIPAGPFWMGAQMDDPQARNFDSEAYDHEAPVHEVFLDAYQLARYPVTVAEYARFVETGGYSNHDYWQAGGFKQDKRSQPGGWREQLRHLNRPVTGVSWYEAAAYAAWANELLPGCRLPTEAEWERAARGVIGRIFPWSDDAPTAWRLNFNANVGHPTPVGIYPRGTTPLEEGNEFGLADMAGNVWEWCSDWFAKKYYAQSPKENPHGPDKGIGRVLRGGAFGFNSTLVRAAYRNDDHPFNRTYFVTGFRLART